MQSSFRKYSPKLPRLQHASLPIFDGEQESIRLFYQEIVGLTEIPVPLALAERGVLWFAIGDGETEIHFLPDVHLSHPEDGRHICFEVEDLESYQRKLEEAGYPIIEDVPIPHRPRFFSFDPCGNRLEFSAILGDYRIAE